MVPSFWKLCQGPDQFSLADVQRSIHEQLAYVHKDAGPADKEEFRQGVHFVNAPIGDYFYLTHGLHGVYLLGQFTGPANVFSRKAGGWLDRPYRVIRFSDRGGNYDGDDGVWAPQETSGFIRIPERLLSHFESQILVPYFGITLMDFAVRI
ncbi:MAG: hypothetical protein J5I93_17540 [Pirellulaceae bacterium]|nr:hypothetical protein [Pirellulaceae bacterium]